MSYNLIDQAWIPVLYHDGVWERVGILKAFEDAHRIRSIATSNPMDRIAIFRFLLAVLYWCKGNPPDVPTSLPSRFPSDWFEKITGHRAYFDLLGNPRRFYQYSDSAKNPEKLAANYLIHEVPTGINKWHFRHATDTVDGLCCACCAMGLLRLPMFSTCGGKGKPPGINSKPPLYVVPLGDTLAESLCLSWKHHESLGSPFWETPSGKLPRDGELLAGLTWVPRQAWLDGPDSAPAACISCGKKQPLIRTCIFAGIGSTKGGSETPVTSWHDPHVVYVTDAKGERSAVHASDVLAAADSASGTWSKLLAQILAHYSIGSATSLWLAGFSTVQNDKYLEATELTIPLPDSTMNTAELTEAFQRWHEFGKRLLKALQQRTGTSPPRAFEKLSPGAGIRPQIEARVAAEVPNILAGASALGNLSDTYDPMLAALAGSLAPGYSSASVMRRKSIADTASRISAKVASQKTRTTKAPRR